MLSTPTSHVQSKTNTYPGSTHDKISAFKLDKSEGLAIYSWKYISLVGIRYVNWIMDNKLVDRTINTRVIFVPWHPSRSLFLDWFEDNLKF